MPSPTRLPIGPGTTDLAARSGQHKQWESPAVQLSLGADRRDRRGYVFQEPRRGVQDAADLAFLLHGLHYLKDDGVMAIILPHDVLAHEAAVTHHIGSEDDGYPPLMRRGRK